MPRLQAASFATFVDELPKVLRFGKFVVFCEWHFRAKEEIGKRAAMQHSMDNYGRIFHFKVKSPVIGAEAVELFAIALNQTKLVAIESFEVVLIDLKFIEQRELGECVHARHLSGADFVKDNLEHEREDVI